MATTNNNNNLFGEDSDSSDESVGGGAAAAAAKSTSPTRTKIDDVGGDSSSDDENEPKKTATTDKVEKDNTTNKSDVNSGGDTKDETKEEASSTPEKEKVATNNNTNNSALFGDDDDDTEDDEFDGEDDGIVGKSGGVNKVIKKAENVGQTMNQRMGLDSDGDEEMEGTKSSKDGDNNKEKKPAYVPPRKMQLLDLAEAGIKTSYDESVPPDQRPVFHLVKLPNLVGIQPKPYDRETHDLEKEEEEYRGYVHNMIRWRYKTNEDGEYIRDEHGQPIRESNTRLVKWSDGSYTLHVGTEVLEMDNLDSSIPMNHPDPSMAGFAGNNGYLYVSQKAKIIPPTKKEMEGPPKSDEDEEKEGANENDDSEEEEQPEAKNAGTVLECIAPIASRLAPRPLSLASDAHRNLTLAVRQRAVKRARIAEIVTEVDPEKEKMARIKGKDDLAKSRARSSGRRSTPGSSGRKHGMNKQYMEEDDDEYDGVNLGRMKKETMRRGDSSEEEEMDYGDSDESEDEWQKNKVQKRGAAVAASKQQESDSDGEIVFGEDDSDEEALGKGKKRAAGSGGAKKTGSAVFGDSDDE